MSTTSGTNNGGAPDLSHLAGEVQGEVQSHELYDGPVIDGRGIDPDLAHDIKPGNPEPIAARPLFADAQPAADAEPVDSSNALRVLFEILSTRVLGLVATVAACLIWACAVWQPDVSRTAAAVGFSVTVLIPIVALYWRTAMMAGRDQ